jgi:flagellar M-ring protein FliF
MANAGSETVGFLGRLDGRAKLAIGVGAVLIVATAVWLTLVVFATEYKVLFSNLAQRDAATIVEQLKQNKVKYRLSDAGGTVSVPAEQVHDVRLQLMSSDLPLSGGVGFEIFDKQGLGTTEHSQRVSFQRALQGELARTIGSLENVKQVRVHLVMPESSLFRKDRQEASAAVTLALQPGAPLDRQQITGIQRLVAASVPGLDAGRVVLTDHRGITLSAGDEGGAGAGAADARLAVKQHIEEYVTRKVAQLLDGAYGPGRAIVTVDATMNFDATKRTIQDLMPASDSSVEGRIVRKRQVVSSGAADSIWTSTSSETTAPPRTPGSSVEMEYEYGRRMEEVVSAPGSLARLSIGIVVSEAFDEATREKIQALVRAAAGIDETRGDVVSVQALLDFNRATEVAASPAVASESVEPGKPENSSRHIAQIGKAPLAEQLQLPANPLIWMLITFAVGIALVFAILHQRRARLHSTARSREQLLREIKTAMGEELRPLQITGRP